MKIYLCVETEWEGSDVFKVCTSRKNAIYVVSQVNRLLNVYHGLRKLSREQQLKYWNDNPQLIDSTKIENYYSSETWKKLNKEMKKTEKILKTFGANSFYKQCHFEEKEVEKW